MTPAHAKWDTPGDRVTVVIRFLGREVPVNMKLEEYQKDNRVTYVSRQQGLPDARHERYFKPVPEGFEFCPVGAFTPRSGLVGLFDRLLLKRAIARALRKTIGISNRLLSNNARAHDNNFKAAKVLGLAILRSVLVRADGLIQ